MDNNSSPSLIRAGVAHVEFEALHPFQDGNGRIGRMLIALYAMEIGGAISATFLYQWLF